MNEKPINADHGGSSNMVDNWDSCDEDSYSYNVISVAGGISSSSSNSSSGGHTTHEVLFVSNIEVGRFVDLLVETISEPVPIPGAEARDPRIGHPPTPSTTAVMQSAYARTDAGPGFAFSFSRRPRGGCECFWLLDKAGKPALMVDTGA
jgi:hypothetical protein